MKDTFIFYKSWMDAIISIPENIQLEILHNIISYATEKKIGNYLSPDITLGQVWTASNIANYMVKLVKKYNTINVNNILDPAVGPATFIKSLFFANLVKSLSGFSFRISS